MKEIKLTLQDYKNSINSCNEWQYAIIVKSFQKYMKKKIDELKKSEEKMYKCIQTPPNRDFYFKVGSLYSENYNFLGFPLSDLPFHFELVESEQESEKITWEEAVKILHHTSSYDDDPLDLLNRIRTDHLQ